MGGLIKGEIQFDSAKSTMEISEKGFIESDIWLYDGGQIRQKAGILRGKLHIVNDESNPFSFPSLFLSFPIKNPIKNRSPDPKTNCVGATPIYRTSSPFHGLGRRAYENEK